MLILLRGTERTRSKLKLICLYQIAALNAYERKMCVCGVGGREREGEKEGEREHPCTLVSVKHALTLSVPHSVSQSACVIIIFKNVCAD